MLSQTAEHALRALLFLAQQTRRGTVPAAEIADAIGAPRNYLSKTLHALARRGIVSGQRGPSGGFRLEVDPSELPLSSLLELFQEPQQRGICLLGGRPCNEATPCQAHFRWQAVWSEALSPFRRTTLADLLAGSVALAATQAQPGTARVA